MTAESRRWVCSCMEDDARACGDDQRRARPCRCPCHEPQWEEEA